ncbi:Glu/Leu/Phe/Val family dehydrogenase [Rhodococcus sp. OK302]|uniref:Glu/Leu/Phe/Val family dehydrogenase n=1 Tax=Rhodococcus sp. OK302 TaxID=1882769 RepID=UPI000B93FB68|nr:Glu/Leu/Phe/Val dehydrogenase dimerization domain-containing protein [Rhodococcus sp. OK302]OYD71357.1 valine dehydrogenase (NAD+) [Rhodococcus sp. OK302]
MTLTAEPVNSVATHNSDDSAGVFDRADYLRNYPHEQVSFFQDPESGLKAIVAIHSTTLGPALGGTRFYPYADESAAVTDVLRLSRGMTYKAAIAGVDLGGGKAVIIGDPATVKSERLLGAYAKFVQTLGGRYITAGDVGTNSDDLDVIGRGTDFVVGRNAKVGGSGDSAPMTALGVFQSMVAAAQAHWGSRSLAGKTVGVEGTGKVGYELIKLLLADGASVLATDVNAAALDRVKTDFPSVKIVDSVIDADLDVYAPCAMGATLTDASARSITADVICGAANNQLTVPEIESILSERGITWVPDYVANGGGLIQVAGELKDLTAQQVKDQVEKIFDTVTEIFAKAKADGILAGDAADAVAEARIAKAVQSHKQN